MTMKPYRPEHVPSTCVHQQRSIFRQSHLARDPSRSAHCRVVDNFEPAQLQPRISQSCVDRSRTSCRSFSSSTARMRAPKCRGSSVMLRSRFTWKNMPARDRRRLLASRASRARSTLEEVSVTTVARQALTSPRAQEARRRVRRDRRSVCWCDGASFSRLSATEGIKSHFLCIHEQAAQLTPQFRGSKAFGRQGGATERRSVFAYMTLLTGRTRR